VLTGKFAVQHCALCASEWESTHAPKSKQAGEHQHRRKPETRKESDSAGEHTGTEEGEMRRI